MSSIEMTIEQLASTVGMTVRNVRAYASRGLLPAPLLVEGVIAWRRADEAGVTFAALEPDATATVAEYVARRRA